MRDIIMEDPLGRAPSLVGVIFSGAGFTAWGPNAIGGSAIVASSADLSGWSGDDTLGQFDGMKIAAMAWAPAGIVALGTDGAGIVHAWRSVDGTTWKAGPAKTGIDGVVYALVSSGGGTYHAAGTAKGGCDVAIWSSYDGLVWQPSEALSGARGTCSTGGTNNGPKITLLRDGGAGLVAYGTVPGRGSVFWTSVDRVYWTFHPQPSLGGHVSALAATRGGYVAVGTIGTGGAAVWLSPDGVAWTRVPDQAVFRDATMTDVRTLDDGSLIAVGGDSDNGFVAWTSIDGLAWVPEPAPLSPAGVALRRPDLPVQWVLASDGHASTNPSELLIAVGGGSGAMVSPPTTHDLRAGTLTVTLSGRVELPTGTVADSCSEAEDGTGSTAIQAVLASLAAPNPADVYLVVTPDGQVTDFRINSDGLSVGVGQGTRIDPSTFTIAPGSTTRNGGAAFRGLVDTFSPAGAKLLSGSLAWTCAW